MSPGSGESAQLGRLGFQCVKRSGSGSLQGFGIKEKVAQQPHRAAKEKAGAKATTIAKIIRNAGTRPHR